MFLYGPADTHFGHVDKWLDRQTDFRARKISGRRVRVLEAKYGQNALAAEVAQTIVLSRLPACRERQTTKNDGLPH